MPTTKAQSLANQRNARKSTGPRTEAGKARSKMNALDHGLRAEQVVLPTEDPAAFAEELAGWFEDWRPTTRARAALVERAAVGAWRLRRCVRQEAAMFRVAVRAAGRGFDEQVNAGVAEGLDLLDADPPLGLARLRETVAGLGALLDLWLGVLRAVEEPTGWTEPDAHHDRLRALLGLPDEVPSSEGGPAVLASFRLVLHNDRVPGADPANHLPPDRAEAEAETIRAVARAEVAAIRAELAGREPLEVTRSRHVEMVAAEPTGRAQAIHRYEMAHDRAFRATLNGLMTMARSGIDEAAVTGEHVDHQQYVEADSATIPPAVPAPIEAEPPPIDPPAPNEAIGPKSNLGEDLRASPPADPAGPTSSPDPESGGRPASARWPEVGAQVGPISAGSSS